MTEHAGTAIMTEPVFRLSLAGRFELEGREGPVKLPGRKLAGLLAALVLHAPVAVSREKLATLLWGSYFEQQARQNLRQTLFRLRRVLGQDAIVGTESTVLLQPGIVECDVVRIRELIRDGSRLALAEAAALYEGSLVAGLAISEEAWCEWLGQQNRNLEELVQDAMLRLADLALAAGDHQQALSAANRVLAINSLREDAHRLVMRALIASGRRADALRHYEVLVTHLKAELSTTPDPSTRTLAAGLLSQHAKPAAEALDAKLGELPNRPAIAVLPFANVSGDPSQDYLSDGIAEDIIIELSRFSGLFVIARNSSFRYRSHAVDLRKVGSDLGVRYVLEGSVRRAGDRARITAQLVDAERGAHLWAERFDRPLVDIFEIQDETVRGIVSVLAAHLNRAEGERIMLTPPSDWRAYHYYMRARQSYAAYFGLAKVEILYDARALLQRALSLDPGYARAQAMLADTYVTTAVNPLDGDYMRESVLDRAHELALAALHLDHGLPEAHGALGRTLLWKRQHEAALAAFDRASTLNPNLTDWRLAACLSFAGEPERALATAKAYMRLDPFYLPSAQLYVGRSLFLLKRFEEALLPILEVAPRLWNFLPVHVALATTYAHCGQLDNAHAQAAEVLRIKPDYRIAAHMRLAPYRLQEHAELYFGGLKKAGLPES